MRGWPFEGRADELALVRRAFAGRAGNALLVRAGPGVGKTRLVREALAALSCRTEWIVATRAATAIPFGALTHLMPDDARPATGPVELLRGIRSRVAGWGGRRQVALGVDDAHLLDDASSTVIADLVASGAAFAVLTVRRGEPLADCLARLGKDGEADVLELDVLPDDVIDRLIDHSTGGAMAAVRRRRLRIAAGGNPLALRELLHGAVPGGLTELVASRLDRLRPDTRRVIEMVACAGAVPLGFLERLVGAGAVADAEESGLLTCERVGARVQARLDHPLFGEVLRSRMPVARARQVYRDLASELLGTPMRRREDTLRAALWQIEGGQIIRPQLVREGARLAIGRAGLVLAERLARAARSAEPGADSDWLLAEILEYQGRSAEAADLLPVTPPAARSERIPWAIARATWLYWACGDLEAALRALDSAAGDSVIEGSRAFTLFFAGRLTDVVRIAPAVLDGDDPRGIVWAAAAATAALGFQGREDEAERVHARGSVVATVHAATLPWGAFQVGIGACLAHLAAGQPLPAAAVADAGYEASLAGGAPMMVSGWALYGGITAASRGDLKRAELLLNEAYIGFERTDTFRLRRLCLAARAWVRALVGDSQAASELMSRADRQCDGTNEVFEPWIDTWRAWVTRAGGDNVMAAEQAHRAAARALTAGMPVVAALAGYDAVRVGGATDPAWLAALPGPLSALLAAASNALAAGDGAGLGRVAGDLDRLGYRLHAAELATAAVRSLRRSGHRGSAGLASATATQLRAGCPGADTPLLARADLGDLLTAREQQIALLAARHTSKQIADQLGLALPTVNNTLARAYVKLGVTRRDQLRALLG